MTDELTYFDSSALAKLVLPDEAGAELAASIYSGNAHRLTSMLSYPETRSALARRFRNRELDETELEATLSRFELIWPTFGLMSVEDAYVMLAAELVTQFPLSGADAVQLATAQIAAVEVSLTFVSWDRRQAEAAQALGFTVQPTLV